MEKEVKQNKTKGIFAAFASIVFALGIVLAVAPKDVMKTEAAPVSVTHTFNSKEWKTDSTTKDWTSKKDGNSFTKNQGIQITTGFSGANATSGDSYNGIVSTTVTYSTNDKKGAGKISMYTVPKAGGAEIQIGNSFNVTAPSSGGTTDKTTTFTPSTTPVESYLKIVVNCSTNSIYIKSVEVTYDEGGGEPTPTLSGISVKSGTAPNKLNYYVGDVFDPTGVTIEASYSDGSKKDVTNLATYTPSPLTLGTTSVTVTYEEMTTTISGLSVESIPVLQSISVEGTPKKLQYNHGESFDPTGITVYAVFDKGPKENITSEVTYSPVQLSTGDTSVTVTYNGFTTTISGLTVEALPVLQSIYVTGTPTKLEYYAGESFDPTGITVYAHYDKGDDVDVTSNVTYSPSTLTEGMTKVTATYEDKTVDIEGLIVTTIQSGTVKYEITGKDTLTASGTAPGGSSAALVSTYTTDNNQITKDNSHTVTLKGYNVIKITEITMSMHSNKSAGSGNFTYSLDNGTTWNTIIATNAFNQPSWNGSYSESYVQINKLVNIEVDSEVLFKVSSTKNSLFVQSYQFKWELQNTAPVTLTGLTMNKSAFELVEGSTEELSVTPTPKNALYDVTWSSSNTAVATVDQDGAVTAVSAGTSTITATDKTNTSIKAISVVTVIPKPDIDSFAKVTDASKIVVGARYVISAVNSGTIKVMSTTQNGNNRAAINAEVAYGEIVETEDTQVFILEEGTETNSYSFKAENGDTVNQYICAASSTSNYLHSTNTKDANSSWSISVSSNGVAEVKAQGTYSRNTLKYNGNNSDLFSAYASGQTDISLYVDEKSIVEADPIKIEADTFAEEVMTGIGLGAQGQCNALYDLLKDEYEGLTADAKELFNTHSDYIDARARMAYLEAWVALNPEKSNQTSTNVDNAGNSILAAVVIGAIGITTLGGYFFLNKKKETIEK